MRMISRIAIAIAALAAASSFASAKDWKKIVVGMDATYPPFESQDSGGNIVGFDRTPWPLLLTLLNLPQLSIMISLQVSANRAQAASDARAMADHATLVALHELAKRQVRILDGQNEVLEILRRAVAGGPPNAA